MGKYYKTLSEAINTLTCLPMLVALERFGRHYMINEAGIIVFKDADTDDVIQPILYVDLKYNIITKKELDNNVVKK